jgi:hypothetical protein
MEYISQNENISCVTYFAIYFTTEKITLLVVMDKQREYGRWKSTVLCKITSTLAPTRYTVSTDRDILH